MDNLILINEKIKLSLVLDSALVIYIRRNYAKPIGFAVAFYFLEKKHY
jgi:hypothetical protein